MPFLPRSIGRTIDPSLTKASPERTRCAHHRLSPLLHLATTLCGIGHVGHRRILRLSSQPSFTAASETSAVRIRIVAVWEKTCEAQGAAVLSLALPEILMQVIQQHRHDASPLGQRRGISDLARFALDLTWGRADTKSAARSGAYPSPPMSGSPQLPPKASQEAAERRQTGYPATFSSAHDVHQRAPATQTTPPRLGAPAPIVQASPTPSYAVEAAERMPYMFTRPETSAPRSVPYLPQHGQSSLPPQPYLPSPTGALGPGPGHGHGHGPGSGPGPGPGPSTGHDSFFMNLPAAPAYVTGARPPPQETSPKSQRKTKGHVASACVPCKKAHLRLVDFPGPVLPLFGIQTLTSSRCDGTYHKSSSEWSKSTPSIYIEVCVRTKA